jgi:hypothetical protein
MHHVRTMKPRNVSMLVLASLLSAATMAHAEPRATARARAVVTRPRTTAPAPAPCQERDPRLACGRSLHHYSEFERLSQQDVYATGSFFGGSQE